MNKASPRARFVRGFLIAIGPTLVWAATLDLRHITSDNTVTLGMALIAAVVAGGLAALLAWREWLQGGGIFARAGAQAIEMFAAGVGVLVLTDLTTSAIVVYMSEIGATAGQAILGAVAALVLNAAEDEAPALPTT